MSKKIAITIALAASVLAGCTQPETAKRALEAQGFSDIQMKGYAFFGCGKDDLYSDKFTAKNAKGAPVSGVVCGGLLKGATVRFD